MMNFWLYPMDNLNLYLYILNTICIGSKFRQKTFSLFFVESKRIQVILLPIWVFIPEGPTRLTEVDKVDEIVVEEEISEKVCVVKGGVNEDTRSLKIALEITTVDTVLRSLIEEVAWGGSEADPANKDEITSVVGISFVDKLWVFQIEKVAPGWPVESVFIAVDCKLLPTSVISVWRSVLTMLSPEEAILDAIADDAKGEVTMESITVAVNSDEVSSELWEDCNSVA